MHNYLLWFLKQRRVNENINEIEKKRERNRSNLKTSESCNWCIEYQIILYERMVFNWCDQFMKVGMSFLVTHILLLLLLLMPLKSIWRKFHKTKNKKINWTNPKQIMRFNVVVDIAVCMLLNLISCWLIRWFQVNFSSLCMCRLCTMV